MNNSGFQIKNNYFSPALYIKLIVNNMKYRGIQCDFGRLTNVFFVTPDSLLFAVQRDTGFFQYTEYCWVKNPVQKSVLNKAGIAAQKSGNRNLRLTDAVGQAVSLKENSTVFLTIKPSAIGTFRFAKGCISEYRAIRACLAIRISNN